MQDRLAGMEPPYTGPVVVLAASAGGIEALQEVLRELPDSFGCPILIVQHRSPTRRSYLRDILARSSPLRIKDVANGDRLRPGTVYLTPADMHAHLTSDRGIELSDGRRIAHVRSSANPLLTSAAHTVGDRLIAVILSGRGSSGAQALLDVKAKGGTIIAQDPRSAKAPGMPSAAIATGTVDVLLLAEIAKKLASLTS